MKTPKHQMKYFYLFLLALLPSLISAQKATLISGEISNLGSPTVSVQTDLLKIGQTPESNTAEVGNGKFELSFKLKNTDLVRLKIGEQELDLFLDPGNKISFTLDGPIQSGKIQFSGNQAVENNYFAGFQKGFSEDFNPKQMEKKILESSSVDMFELDLYQRGVEMKENYAEANKASNFSNGFQAFMSAQISYHYKHWMMAYPIVKANNNPKNMLVKHLPRTIEKGFDDSQTNKTDALLSSSYRNFIYYFVTYNASKAHNFTKFKDFNNSVDFKVNTASEKLSGETQTWYLARICYENCEKTAPGTMDKVRAKVKKAPSGDRYKKVLEEKCSTVNASKSLAMKTAEKEQGKSKKKKGKKKKTPKNEIYPFRMIGLDGNEMHLSDFHGKVVYIDFWASWCGPCRRQFPYSKKLHADMEDKLGKKGMDDIVFLYISIDKTEAAWRNAVKKFSLKGVQAYSASQWPDGAGNFFQIRGIPRYMIIGKDGQILHKSAKRPSMPGIMDDLINLL